MKEIRFKPIHKKIIMGVVILGIVIVAGFYAFLWGGVYVEKLQTEKIAKRIELFKEQHSRLPDKTNNEEMQALGFELRVGWTPDFISLNDSDYELWLYYGFDGPHMVYNSRTKTWREEY